MSSLRNAVKRITHKERSQPQHRSRLGHLEKKKDYVLRAKNYHAKEDRIKALQEKAAMKNPDEFYFGMHRAEIKDGIHRKTVAAQRKEFIDNVGHDTIRIMKNQDMAYLRMQRQKETKKIEKLQSSLHVLDETSSKKRKHTIFVGSKEEADDFDVANHFDTLPELAGRAFNRPRIETLRKSVVGNEGDEESKGQSKLKLARGKIVKQAQNDQKNRKEFAIARSQAFVELEGRMKRIETLERAEAHLVTEKLLASKGRKRKIKPAENGRPAQYKWRYKRLG